MAAGLGLYHRHPRHPIVIVSVLFILWTLDIFQLPAFSTSTSCAAHPIHDHPIHRKEYVTFAETYGIQEDLRQEQDEETNVAAIKLMKKILDKTSEKLSNLEENNEKERLQSVLDKYVTQFSEYGRFKREISGTVNSSTTDETTETTAPGDRMGHKIARWVTIIGGILIVIAAILIVVYYCKCKACCVRGLRGASFEDNPRATVSVVPSGGFQRPPGLYQQPFHNSSFGPYSTNFDHHRAPGSRNFGNYHYMKALEKNPELRASELMFDP